MTLTWSTTHEKENCDVIPMVAGLGKNCDFNVLLAQVNKGNSLNPFKLIILLIENLFNSLRNRFYSKISFCFILNFNFDERRKWMANSIQKVRPVNSRKHSSFLTPSVSILHGFDCFYLRFFHLVRLKIEFSNKSIQLHLTDLQITHKMTAINSVDLDLKRVRIRNLRFSVEKRTPTQLHRLWGYSAIGRRFKEKIQFPFQAFTELQVNKLETNKKLKMLEVQTEMQKKAKKNYEITDREIQSLGGGTRWVSHGWRLNSE